MNGIKYDIDGVIFDLGSTLIEYENIPWDELNLTCMAAGYQFLKKGGHNPPEFEIFRAQYNEVRRDFREYAAATLREWDITDAIHQLLLISGIGGGRRMADIFFQEYYKPVAEQLTIFDDTLKVLKELRARRKKIGLVSNTIFPEGYHRKELHDFGIGDFLDFALFSSSFGFRKPHSSIYGKAAELMAIDKSRLLFVGDRFIEDYKGPRDFGMKAILRIREGREYPKPMAEGAIVVGTLSEILRYIC
jgi:HAD superfamily hydrolase (TIGR01549 family)